MKNRIVMRRIASLCLVLLMVLGCCACGGTATVTPVTPGNEGAQYVIALNPSIAFEDTTVNSIRNTAASAMQTDIKAETPTALYDSAWRWSKHNTETGEWDVRLLRDLVTFRYASGATVKGAPYAYTVTDSGLSSLAVFDTSKMAIKGINDGDMPGSGILMSFTGTEEEAISFTADKDCVIEVADRDMGNVAIVSSVCGADTNFTTKDGAKKAIVVRVYKNNRIYWQEVLDGENTAVAFPSFNGLELKMGDSIIVTAQAMDDTSGIITGNCDLPARTATVIEKTPIETVVEDVTSKGMSLLDENGNFAYTIIRPESTSSQFAQAVSTLSNGIRNKTGLSVPYEMDNIEVTGLKIFLYNAQDDDTLKAYNEVKNGRKLNAADFIIRVSGQNIIITAATDLGMEVAVDFFLDNYIVDRTSRLPLDLNYVSSKFNPNKDIKLAGVSIQKYRLVVARGASYMTTLAAKELAKEIAILSGFEPTIVRDGGYSTRQDYEISVGDTDVANYHGLDDYTQYADADGSYAYEIKVNAKNTTLLGSHVAASNAASVEFAKLLKEKTTLAKGFKQTGEYDGEYSLSEGYKLTWSDEFNTEKLNPTWLVSSIHGNVQANSYGGTTRIIKPVIRNGAAEFLTDRIGNTNDFTAVSLESRGPNTMNYMWGYCEARVMLAKQVGLSSALWTKASVTGGFLESDIWENFGNPFRVKHNLHTWEDSGHKNLLGGRGDTLNNAPGIGGQVEYGWEYHTVGWEWTDDYSQFYVDGQPTIRFDSTAAAFDVFNKPAWLIVGSGPSSHDYGTPVKNDFDFDIDYFDYIQIYQKNDGSVMYVKK